MFKNKNLLVIAVIAVVNALGYGIIIPVLYSYSQKFGLSDFQNGLLFSLFSVCQFLSTPVIGRMSDKYGRKPLLIISITGTAISFLMMAFAPSAVWLFLARALDGLTAGNIPVASAVISDTTAAQERAKGFGIIGASFGFGFVFGPAISALTLPWGDAVPFLIAAAVSIAAVALTYKVLPETNTHLGEVRHGKLFDFTHLVKVLFDPAVGMTLAISLFYSLAFGILIYAFQPFSVKVLHLTAQQISLIFTSIGLVGVVAQATIIPRFSRRFGERRVMTVALTVMASCFLTFFGVRNFWLFFLVIVVNATANAFVGPLLQALLSKEVDVKSQGSILGVNSSYISLGMIAGPIAGGAAATFSAPMPFLIGSVFLVLCVILAFSVLRKPHPVQHAF